MPEAHVDCAIYGEKPYRVYLRALRACLHILLLVKTPALQRGPFCAFALGAAMLCALVLGDPRVEAPQR